MIAHRRVRMYCAVAWFSVAALGDAAAPPATPRTPVKADPAKQAAQQEEEKKKAHDEDVRRALEVFEVKYKAKEDQVRVAAIAELSAVKDKKILDRFARVVQGTETDVIKIRAIQAIGGYAGELRAAHILQPLLATYKKRPEMMVPVLEALGEVGGRAVVSQLIDLYRDKSPSVARAAIVASARIRDKSCVDPLLRMLKEFDEFKGRPQPAGAASPADEEMAKRKAELEDPTRRALSDITLQSFGTVKEWDAWWRKNKGSFTTDPAVKK